MARVTVIVPDKDRKLPPRTEYLNFIGSDLTPRVCALAYIEFNNDILEFDQVDDAINDMDGLVISSDKQHAALYTEDGDMFFIIN